MKQFNYKKFLKTCFCTISLTILCTMTIWAGTWESTESGGYKYKNDNGTYLSNTWLQEHGKWYFFDENGKMAVDTAVDGYEIGADGTELSGTETITSQYPQIIVPADTTTVTYVLNKNTKKFHKPACSSVSDMAAKNRLDSGSSRDEVIAQGYEPCKRCKP